ncbi:hypothetical protein ACFSSA_12985 [Luteolibacter algae]|uniref:PilZ domain-containing protein n=1 Tax=Luteolibacter algae TaxID=454151 RepID=A0ABW5DA27_9BACT
MNLPPPLCMEHRVRVSVLEPEKTWKIAGKSLIIGIDGFSDTEIPLSAIGEIRLEFAPSRVQTNRFRCKITCPPGGTYLIQNEHFKGVMSFEDRSETYNDFIRALISRTDQLNPACTFRAGISAIRWWLNLLFTCVIFLFLALTLLFLYTAIGALVIVKLLIIAFFIPVLVRWFIRNKPKNFSPDCIPEALLPKTN